MHFVQRDHERALLRQLYEDCVPNRGRIVHLTGPTASGKSALLNDFVDHVTASGGLHIPASGVRSEQNLPLGLINQIMGAAGLETIEPTGGSEASSSGDLPLWLIPQLDELSRELKVIASRAPLVLHVDDAHLADVDSVCCLLYVLRRLREAPVMTVITEQPPAQEAVAEHLTALAWLPHSTRIRLSLLSAPQVRDLLSQHWGGTLHEETVTDLIRATGGIPALVRAVLEDHRPDRNRSPEGPGAAIGTSPGAAYCTALTELLHRHEPAVLEVAKILAVLGEESSVQEQPTSRLPLGARERACLDRLRAVGLLGPNGFPHPMTRVAVLTLMDPQDRARTHLRCARLLYEADASVSQIARHLRCAEHVDDPWAIPFLHEASEQALADGELSSAIDHLSSAVALCTDPEQKPKLVLALAVVLRRADPEAASRHLVRLAEEAAAGKLSACELYSLARALLWSGHHDEVERLLLRAPASVTCDPGPDTALEIRITRATCATDYPEITDLLPQPPRQEENPGTLRITTSLARLTGAESLAESLLSGEGPRAVAKAEEVLSNAGLGEHMMEAVFAAVSALIYADRVERAAYWSDSLIAMPGRSPLWYASAHVLRAETALRTGDLGVAHHHTRIALASIPRSGWGTVLGLPLSHVLQIAMITGDRQECARIMAEPVGEELFRSRYGLPFLQTRGHYHLDAGHTEAALSDFSLCGALVEKWGLDNPALVGWRGGAARAHLQLGDRKAARALAHEQVEMLAPHLGRTRGIVLLDLATVLMPRARVPVLEKAVHLLDEGSDRLGGARARLELADALEAVNETGLPQILRERAQHALSRCTAPPQGERRTLSPIPTGKAAPAHPAFDVVRSTTPPLSTAEHRVARLAADGMTNRQISSTLHITISTVEQHLTRIYRKFAISNRQQIRELLAPKRDMVR